MPQTVSLDLLTGPQRAAVLLLTLGPTLAAEIITRLTGNDAERIFLEIARLPRTVTLEQMESAVEHARMLASAGAGVTAGREAALRLARETYGDKSGEVERRLTAQLEDEPFVFLNDIEPRLIANALQDEHPQTIALVLSYLLPEKVSDVLDSLSSRPIALEAAYRLTTLSSARDSEVVDAVQEQLNRRLDSVRGSRSGTNFDGKTQIVAVLTTGSKKELETQMLDYFQKIDKVLAEEIKAKMFTFSDLDRVSLDDLYKVIQKALANEVPIDELSAALKLAEVGLREKIINLLPAENQEIVKEDMERKFKKSKIEEAQDKIVKIARKMADDGEITINRGGSVDSDPLF